MNELLGILQVIFPQFPKESRTLLQTPSSCPYELKSVSPGFYCHIDIENELLKIIINKSFSMQKYLTQNAGIILPLNINVDSLPIYNSSKCELWLILISIDLDIVDGNIKISFMAVVYHGHNHRLPETDKNDINNQLLFLKNYMPKDFVRLPRSLEDIEYYKATELRQFLLYTGPVVLEKIMNKNIYTHFMALSCVIRILCGSALYRKYNNYALKLLEYFVKKYVMLYGEEYISHNVHGLIHLSTDCLQHGPLDSFSCFKYENYLFTIKKTIQATRNPLQQICNRLKEHEHMQNNNNNEKTSNFRSTMY
ncbi:hypothetical protein ALC57_13815 [Trachymyrmex cornetzi]|uniref:DUF4218 domain-containing protein n=1 Tax=Trachymyrmex cornetzi TaxID=471704 RepID=A0A151IZ13_9HYME|nr:hypothetical protein ALC57_13815 [Trachymyrmex cornetzi]